MTRRETCRRQRFWASLRRVNSSSRPRRSRLNETNTNAADMQSWRAAASKHHKVPSRLRENTEFLQAEIPRGPRSRPEPSELGSPEPELGSGVPRLPNTPGREVDPVRHAERDELSGISFESFALGGAKFPDCAASALPRSSGANVLSGGTRGAKKNPLQPHFPPLGTLGALHFGMSGWIRFSAPLPKKFREHAG